MATLDDVFSRDIDTSSFAIYGGACTEADITAAREELWPRPGAGDVGPFWSFLYGLKVFGLAADVPDWLDLRVETERLGAGDLVPFLAAEGDADRYCFDRAGQVVRWSHEEPDARPVVAEGFVDVLLREIGELEDRLQRKLAERSGVGRG